MQGIQGVIQIAFSILLEAAIVRWQRIKVVTRGIEPSSLILDEGFFYTKIIIRGE
jgi:hypothetical protein